MIVNANHVGQTEGGRYAYRPFIQMEPDDFPPNSQFWSLAFDQAKADIISLIGPQYTDLAEMIWPKDTIEEYSWKELTQQLGAALNAYKLGERNLSHLCVAAWDAVVAQPEYLKD